MKAKTWAIYWSPTTNEWRLSCGCEASYKETSIDYEDVELIEYSAYEKCIKAMKNHIEHHKKRTELHDVLEELQEL